MRILIGYNESDAAGKALSLARDHAEVFNAKAFIMTSMEGGDKETTREIRKVEENLQKAKKFMEEKGIDCETHQVVHGKSPGEDIVWYAEDNNIDLIFVGIQKKSKAQKILLGSNAQYVILKASCPVTTVK
jgi:nucleotide-binding universal stress UspA family protein